VAGLLAVLRRAAKFADGKTPPRESVIRLYDSRAEERIYEALRRPVSVSLKETSLVNLAAAWSKEHKFEIALNHRRLGEIGVDPAKSLFGLHVSNVSLRSALDLILREHGLSWIIQDEALLITSRDGADETLTTRLYPVADLIAGNPAVHEAFDGQSVPADDGDSLIETIRNTVRLDTWRAAGGPGTLEYNRMSAALVCSQNREGHEDVERLIGELRRHGKWPKRPAKANPAEPPDGVQLRDDAFGVRAYPIPVDSAVRAKVTEETASLIQELIAADTWKAKDTQALLRVWPDRLIVRQTGKVHREIQTLLDDLGLLMPAGPSQPPAPPPRDE
jgi:hypothetical protein